MSEPEEEEEVKYLPGHKVICVKKPGEDKYQCKVGAIATIKSLNVKDITTIKTVEDIYIGEADYQHACYDIKCFKHYIPRGEVLWTTSK